jgi:hypothetical protein
LSGLHQLTLFRRGISRGGYRSSCTWKKSTVRGNIVHTCVGKCAVYGIIHSV